MVNTRPVSVLIAWERDIFADTDARAGFGWFSTDPAHPAHGTVSVPAAWSRQPATVAGEVEIAARAALGNRRQIVIVDGRTPPTPTPPGATAYGDHAQGVRDQFWAALHCRLRYEADAHRAHLNRRITAEGLEFARSNNGRVHRLDCATITGHVWHDNIPGVLHKARVQAERLGAVGHLEGIHRVDVAAVAHTIMHRNVDPELLSRPQVGKIRNARGCQICQSITDSPLRNTRSIPATTMTDRILGREAFTEASVSCGTVTGMDRTSRLIGDRVDVTVTLTFDTGKTCTLVGEESLAFGVRPPTTTGATSPAQQEETG